MTEINLLDGALYNPASGGGENPRTPTVFKQGTIAPAAVNSNFWTPVAGKSFRLLGFHISVAANAAGATNEISVALNDTPTSALSIATFALFVPTTSVVTSPGQILIASINLPGNGWLSHAVGNLCQMSVSNTLTSGTIRINAWGTEE